MSESAIPETQLQLRSTITSDAKLILNLETVPVPAPGEDEVLIRIEAAPINPSDLALLLGPADVGTMVVSGSPDNPTVTMDVPEGMLKAVSMRLDQSMSLGNEGAGVVVAAGKNVEALLGKTVGLAGGSMYSQYRCIEATSCLVMNDNTSAVQAASSFINPLTALCMVETMRLENHRALVHTAAASNLGQMLVKICQADNVPLVTIVRNEQQVELLRDLGAEYICNSSADNFMEELIAALIATGATIAFDAIGGGKLAGQILTAMEIAINNDVKVYNRYGSTVPKQVYIYGMLDRGPTTFNRSFGLTWGIEGWLLTPFLARLGLERLQQLRQRVADEIDTTFASHYSAEISLAEALSESAIKQYSKQATGEKYLIRPQQ